METTRRAWMEIDAGALRRNYDRLRRRVGPGPGMLPMIKADGYGLGAVRVLRALRSREPWGFGVATAAEGRTLRRAGWDGRVVVFSPCLLLDLPAIRALELEPAVSGPGSLGALEGGAPAEGGPTEEAPLPVHVEVDTGMGRLGFPWDGGGDWIPRLAGLVDRRRVRIASTFTHFHSAGSDPAATGEQWRRFREALSDMRAAGLDPGPRHAANSAAALSHPSTRGDVVRPGLFLFGGGAGELRPEAVVRVRARALEVREMAAGATVSYGATYRTTRRTRLATVGIGYGDGLRRELSNAGHVLVDGRRAPIRGRVCMDLTVVELPEESRLEAGDPVTVLGEEGSARIGLSEMAERCGTIEYEILTGWSPRLPRLVRGEARSEAEPGDRDALGAGEETG